MISILLTFASTTVKIYLELSEHEIFDKMKGAIAIVSYSEFLTRTKTKTKPSSTRLAQDIYPIIREIDKIDKTRMRTTEKTHAKGPKPSP